jgi:RNA polymerase sigma-70 factor (ECF subfamily)
MDSERWREDRELLEAIRRGEEAAVEELFDRFHARIYSLAMSIVRNESDAQEAVQDVFLTVVRKADTFQWNSALFSWIYRICVNTCLMRLRGRKRNETVSLEEFMPVFNEEGMHVSPVEDWTGKAEKDLLNRELGQVIRKASDALSEKYRIVFLLSDVEGLSNEEAAEVLGLSVPAVKSRLHRARLFLRERISRYLVHGAAE